ncbi:hypothetical protein [Streptomyces indiaensis]|nr:hypothetical protein [Streptomyces indiaensis]
MSMRDTLPGRVRAVVSRREQTGVPTSEYGPVSPPSSSVTA